MKNKTIILINGLPRVGKDTSADFILKKLKSIKISFAGPLKGIVARTFDITEDKLEKYKNNPDEYVIDIKKLSVEPTYLNKILNFFGLETIKKDNVIKTMTFRKILQLFGTEGIKPEFGKDVWGNLLYQKALLSDNDIIVVPDYRFMSEYIPQPGINIIRILIKDHRELPVEGHASDVELYQNNVKFDYIIENKGTLIELEKNINSVLTQIEESINVRP